MGRHINDPTYRWSGYSCETIEATYNYTSADNLIIEKGES